MHALRHTQHRIAQPPQGSKCRQLPATHPARAARHHICAHQVLRAMLSRCCLPTLAVLSSHWSVLVASTCAEMTSILTPLLPSGADAQMEELSDSARQSSVSTGQQAVCIMIAACQRGIMLSAYVASDPRVKHRILLNSTAMCQSTRFYRR